LEVKEGRKLNLHFHDLKKFKIQVWGISATIGNLEQASDVLLGTNFPKTEKIIIRANEEKKISIVSILPDKVETLPWAGHLGINLIDKVVTVVKKYNTTLLFTNTRSQTEIWYRTILEKIPGLRRDNGFTSWIY
jgi:ATP-dependent Lhr-like helicase